MTYTIEQLEAMLAKTTQGSWVLDYELDPSKKRGYAAPEIMGFWRTDKLHNKPRYRPVAKAAYHMGSEDREVDYNAVLIAAAPDLARQLLTTMREIERLQAKVTEAISLITDFGLAENARIDSDSRHPQYDNAHPSVVDEMTADAARKLARLEAFLSEEER